MTRRLAREEMGWFERAHARRLGLAPYYVAFVTLVVGHLSWPFFDQWQTRTLLLVAAVLAVMYVSTRFVGLNHKLYGLVCLVAAGGWIYWLQSLSDGLPEDGWGLLLLQRWGMCMFWLVVGVHLLGLPWWSSKLKRTEVHLEDDLRGWQEVAQNFGLGMTTRHVSKRDASGNESGFIVWPRGSTTVANVLQRREQLEGAMGLQEGTLRLMKHGRDTDRVDYVSFSDDPLTEAIEWPGPQQADDGGDLSVDVPCRVGPQEDKTLADIPYYERDINAVVNKLLGGSQGSGKSGGITLHILDIACRSDGTQWGIDLKDGMEIAPFDDIMDNLATNAAQSVEMLDALDAVMTYRGEENTRQGRKAWPVSPTHPMLFVWIDELHRLLGARNGRSGPEMMRCEEILVRAATTGRALGISVNGATQNPTLEATRTSQFRDRLNQRICFRTESESHAGYIIPNRKFDPHLIPSSQPGMAYCQDRDRWSGMPFRYYLVTDEMVEMILQIRAPGLPLDEGSQQAAAAASSTYADRCARRYGDDHGLGGVLGDVPSGPQDPDGGATVTDISPTPVPPFPSDEDDLPLAAIVAAHRRLSGQETPPEAAPAPEPIPAEIDLSAAPRTVRERAADLPSGMDAVMNLLTLRRENGAMAKELMEAADRKSSWWHRVKQPLLDDGTLVQPDGKSGVYVLAQFASVSSGDTRAQ